MDKETKRKNTKETVLKVVYFPFALLLGIVCSPILVILYAYSRACDQAFEDVWVTNDNPMLNQEGPAMVRKREHSWIYRFIGLDLIKDI